MYPILSIFGSFIFFNIFLFAFGYDDIDFHTQRTENPFAKLSIKMPDIAFDANSKFVGSRSVPEHLMTPTLRNLRDKYGNCASDYHRVSAEVNRSVLNSLPKRLLDIEVPRIEWQIITAEKMLIPHIDVNRKSALNIYLTVDGEETVFYTNATRQYKVAVTGNMIYDEDWLSPFSTFIAEFRDVYLLDVSVVHGVRGFHGVDVVRIALTCGFNLPYDIVLSHLQDWIV